MKAQKVKAGILGSMVAIIGTLGVTVAAQADSADRVGAEANAVVVRYGDLDLRSPDGARALYSRLKWAADRACGTAPPAKEMWRHQQYRACFDSAMDKAVQRVGSTRLQALHKSTRPSTSVG